MKTLVLSKFAMGKTGRKLAAALGADYSAKIPMNYAEYDRIVRWGASYNPFVDNDIEHVLNPAYAIRCMANRYSMFSHMKNHSIEGLDYDFDIGEKPHVSRTLFGKWGKDIMIDGPVGDKRFAVEQWLADFEVRLHIVKGVCVCMQIKRQKTIQINLPMRAWYIRNRQHGWHLYHLHNEEAFKLGINKEVLRNVAKMTIETAQLDFGVVDFLVRCKAPEYEGASTPFVYRVLEVNTAPGLEDATLNRYVERLNA